MTGITAQNKDVMSKWFGETMRNRSLAVYGIDVPRIVDVRPTNLPAVETREQRMDNQQYMRQWIWRKKVRMKVYRRWRWREF